MIIYPAIDICGGMCVRLHKGEYETAHKVAESPLIAAKRFADAGAQWLHTVDLDGAKDKKPVNFNIIAEIAAETGLKVEVGGGIRSMETIDKYFEAGISRVILGSSALSDPELVKTAVLKYGEKIAVGIDARDGMVAANGWLETSDINYLDFAAEMEKIGVRTIIFTDISRDGMLSGPNLEQLEALNNAVSCEIIASGGIRDINDITALRDRFCAGAICGKSLYSGTLSVEDALDEAAKKPDLSPFFEKSELIPAIVQSVDDGEVLMLAYMNAESLQLTIDTGYTWFYSRSRNELWNKGATSGHLQKVCAMHFDCDCDTLLIKVHQTGAACHTGNYSCFYRRIKK